MGKIIECECGAEALNVEKLDDEEFYFSVMVVKGANDLTFWQRLKFLFNRWNVYAEVVLDRKKTNELYETIGEMLNKHQF